MSKGNGKPKLTPTQLEMMRVLSDGRDHWREELHKCLQDELGPITNIIPHLVAIRKHLDAEGKVRLVTHKYGRGETCYQLVPLVAILLRP